METTTRRPGPYEARLAPDTTHFLLGSHVNPSVRQLLNVNNNAAVRTFGRTDAASKKNLPLRLTRSPQALLPVRRRQQRPPPFPPPKAPARLRDYT